MSRLTPRVRWRQAVASEAFPRSERVVRGTLLCLVDLMSSTGELSVMREEIVAATGLPARTIDRHLNRAVAKGWLTHERHGSRGRRSLYCARIPGEDSAPTVARYSVSDGGDSAPSTRGLTHGDSAPISGALNKKSANASERVAVDNHCGRRRPPVGAGVSATDYLGKSSSNGDEWLPTPLKRPSSDSTGEVA